jgi:hypothetical protein
MLTVGILLFCCAQIIFFCYAFGGRLLFETEIKVNTKSDPKGD